MYQSSDAGSSSANGSVPSPILTLLTRQLTSRTGWSVLDLGAARPATMNLYAPHAGRVFIEDLAHDCEAGGTLDIQSSVDRLAAESAATQFDMVFCWDIFNYISRQDAYKLGLALVKSLAPKGYIHLFTWSRPTMPVNPIVFEPSSSGGWTFKLEDQHIPTPRWNKTDLKHFFRPLEVVRASLTKHGLEEHLFEAAPAQLPAPGR